MSLCQTDRAENNEGRQATPPSGGLFLCGFREILPAFCSRQEDLLARLAELHASTGRICEVDVTALFLRYGASPQQIAYRHHELADLTANQGGEFRLLGSPKSDLSQKTQYFNERIDRVFEDLYAETSHPPAALVHVTCTGYSSPSGAQRLVSKKGWGRATQVVHAYHMGCYAAHPALQIGSGYASTGAVDIVHTELCSIHLDPENHGPEQIVIQSLFADGFMKYELLPIAPDGQGSFEILAVHDEIVDDSTHAMQWTPGPFFFVMTLSKDIPTLFASALPSFLERLCAKAGFIFSEERKQAAFAIHPGGPRIIELAERFLELAPWQTSWSHHILRQRGNMSSATLPHIWKAILEDSSIPKGTLIVSVGAGPGLTLSGALFKKR